jgi:hypothetical protein
MLATVQAGDTEDPTRHRNGIDSEESIDITLWTSTPDEDGETA